MDDTQKILEYLRNLETNLITEITTSRVEIEMSLKQIATYLSVSAQNLNDVHDIILKFNTIIENIKLEIQKVEFIKDEIIKMPPPVLNIQKNVNDLVLYLKKVIVHLNNQSTKLNNIESSHAILVDNFKTELGKNQSYLVDVVNKLIDSKDKNKSGVITHDIEKYKIKSNLIMKIVGIVLGSGGVLYFIIDSIIKLAAK